MGLIVNRVQVRLPGFPPSSAPLRIAHLSDFHLGHFASEKQVTTAVEAANQEAPDMIALTGDYVTEGKRFIERIGALLAPLRASLGVHAVLGNHDHRANGGRVESALREAGLQVLHNCSRPLEWRPAGRQPVRLALVGVDDLWRGKGDTAEALKDVPQGLPAVVLSHNPDAIYPLRERPSTLILAGHTHGGQVFRLGRYLLDGTRFGKRYPYGLHRLGEAQVYITSGIGTTLLPIRFFCPAEVAILSITGTA
jgi:predicted MPP superfamily phosphohydrolase